MTWMILAARTPAPPYLTPLVKEAGVGAGEEGEVGGCPPAGDEGRLVYEGHGHEDVDGEPAERWLLLLLHLLPRPLHQRQHMLPTASPSKEQVLRIPLHRPHGPVRWRLVWVGQSCRVMVTSAILWHGMITHPDIHQFRVQRTVRLDLHLRRLRALIVNGRLLLHKRSPDSAREITECELCSSVNRNYFFIENYGKRNIWSVCVC